MSAREISPAHDARSRRVRWLPVAGVAALVGVSVWAFTGNEAANETRAGVRVDPGSAYDPVAAGEPLPDGFRQLRPRDAIMPVYDPTFVAAPDTGWAPDTDVIGVEIDGQAKAYPVAFLGGRELVVDELAGIPILVSW